MKKSIALFLLLISASSFAQLPALKSPPPGGNRKAMVAENIGITQVSIHYDRPGVKGREGKIYGTAIVHEGFTDLGFGTSKAAPWRAGANENTIIEFSTDVKVEGKNLPAGKYGFFIAYGSEESTVIFSKNYSSWGSFFYEEKEDALRVKVKTIKTDKSVEWLKYEFTQQTENSAVIALQWEKVSIPFKVEVDLVKTSIENFRLELRNAQSFGWRAWEQATMFCVQHNTNLEEALDWAESGIQWEKNFKTLSAKAAVLEKLGKTTQADSCMKAAMEFGSMMELHFYGKSLLAQKKNKEAFEVFKFNAAKNPKQFITYAGLTRAYSANGDFKNALTNAKQALALAPDEQNKKSIEGMIQKLKEGKDVN